jgi:hypothetical protein
MGSQALEKTEAVAGQTVDTAADLGEKAVQSVKETGTDAIHTVQEQMANEAETDIDTAKQLNEDLMEQSEIGVDETN